MNPTELRDALRRDADLAGRPPTDLVHRVAGLRRRSRRRRAAALGCVLAVAAAVVGVAVLDGLRGDDRRTEAAVVVDAEAAAQRVRDAVAGAGAAGSRAVAADSLVEYLPSTQYRLPDGRVQALSEAVVVGHVTTVIPGRAFHVDEDEDAVSIEVPFDDPRAMWRTIHAEVAVTEVLGGRLAEDTVVVGLSIGPTSPFDVYAIGLPALGDVVLVLQTGSPVFGYEPGIESIAEDGAMLAEIGPDGRLTFPALEPYRAEQFSAVTPTLESLREAARQPARVLPVEVLQD